MAKKIKVDIGGKKVDAVDLNFNTAREEWNEYELEDGTILRIKSIATKIIRQEDAYNPEGDPIYHVKSTNIVTTDVPDKLKLSAKKGIAN